MADQIRVNGNQLSWGHIIIKIGGDRFYGFTGIAYGDKRERVKAYGQGQHHAPRGRSAGKYTTDPVKITGWKGSIEALRDELAKRSANGLAYGNVEFDIIVQYVGSGEKAMNVEVERCVLVEDTSSHEESADPLKDEISADCMLIRRNGKTLFDSETGAP